MISREKFLKIWPSRKIGVIANYEISADNLIIPYDGDRILNTILWYLRESVQWDILVLHTRPEGYPSSEILLEKCKELGFSVIDLAIGESPYIPLNTNWATFSKHLGGKLLSNIRNREKRLAEFGEVRYEVFTQCDNIDSLMDRIFAVSRKGWAHKENTGICSTPELESYYRNLAQVANQKGWIYFHILSAGGKDVAFEYNLLYDGKVYNLKIGFDLTLEKAAPGKVLKRHVLEDAIYRGAREYDMLGDAESFKREWTQQARRHYKWFIFNRHPYAKFLFTLQTRLWEPLKKRVFYR